MILILGDTEREFSRNLRSVFDRRGEETLLLTCAEIVRDTSIAFYLGTKTADIQIEYKNQIIQANDIKGVYCDINAFMPYLFPHFSSEDANYAAMETQALWLAVLAGLNCRVVNPPALDTLSGTILSPAEFLYLAYNSGFSIPMVIYLESGASAAEIYKSGAPARYSDLGKHWVDELSHNQVNIIPLSENVDHFMVQENLPGKSVWITIIGKSFLACELDKTGTIIKTPSEHIPKPIRSRLLKLNNIQNLYVAEYFFRIDKENNWFLCGVTHPPRISVKTYGEIAFDAIATYILGLGE